MHNEEHLNEIRNKFYNGDMLSLTTEEVVGILKNIMWQHFLVQTYSISVNNSFDELGGNTKIVIEGIMFRDSNNLESEEIELIENSDDFIDDLDNPEVE